MDEIHDCNDCDEIVTSSMIQFRNPYFDDEEYDDEGDKISGIGICIDCWLRWPAEYRWKLIQEKEKLI